VQVRADPATDHAFDPRELSVAVGTTVRWTFADNGPTGNVPVPHDVVGDGFQSPIMTTGTFDHTFATAGTYEYVCSLHPTMTGVVTVAAAQ
jgi:plastocyanin